MDFILFTDEEANKILEMTKEHDFQIVPRIIDNPEHKHFGLFVASANLLKNSDYAEFYLDIDKPVISVEDADALFMPPNY